MQLKTVKTVELDAGEVKEIIRFYLNQKGHTVKEIYFPGAENLIVKAVLDESAENLLI